MEMPESEGLGGSLLIYMGAITGALVVLATPIYLALKPTVYDNPVLVRHNTLLNGPVIGSRETGQMQLAVLKRRVIVDPKVVAALNAKIAKHGERTVTHNQVARHRSAPRGPSMADASDARPRRPTSFLFGLFGG